MAAIQRLRVGYAGNEPVNTNRVVDWLPRPANRIYYTASAVSYQSERLSGEQR